MEPGAADRAAAGGPRSCARQRGRPSPVRVVAAAAAVALAAAACRTDTGVEGGARFEPELRVDAECFGVDVTVEASQVTCGTVAVPLDHTDVETGTVELAVAVLEGRTRDRFPHPLLVLGGGPGGAMVVPFLSLLEVRAGYDIGPDLIVVDQRGTGLSRPSLDCPELDGLDTDTPWADPTETADAWAACRQRLTGDGIDLDAFHHRANARDVDLVRRALGEDSVDVWGLSNGTLVALLAADETPDGVRSLILDSPVDPSMTYAEEAVAADRVLDELSDRCTRDADCQAAVGDLRGAIDDTIRRLAAAPEHVTVMPGYEPVDVTVGPTLFAHSLYELANDPESIALLPAAVHAAQQGDLQPLLRLTVPAERSRRSGWLSEGMYASMFCSAMPSEPADAPTAVAGEQTTLVVPFWLSRDQQRTCRRWNVKPSFDPTAVDLDVDVPALVVTGGLDLVAPPAHGERVLAQLPASQRVHVPDGVHAPLLSLGRCGRQIVADFLQDPTATIDATCADDARIIWQTELPAHLQSAAD